MTEHARRAPTLAALAAFVFLAATACGSAMQTSKLTTGTRASALTTAAGTTALKAAGIDCSLVSAASTPAAPGGPPPPHAETNKCDVEGLVVTFIAFDDTTGRDAGHTMMKSIYGPILKTAESDLAARVARALGGTVESIAL